MPMNSPLLIPTVAFFLTLKGFMILVVDSCHCCLVAKSCLTLVIPWTIACQAPLSMGFSQARILEWVAVPYSRESSQLRDQTPLSCIDWQEDYLLLSQQGSPF